MGCGSFVCLHIFVEGYLVCLKEERREKICTPWPVSETVFLEHLLCAQRLEEGHLPGHSGLALL